MRTKSIDVVLLIFLLCLVYIIIFQVYTPKIEQTYSLGIVIVNGNFINVSIADDNKEMAEGLSKRLFLKHNQGMLFIYPDAKERSFWMKDMKFAIDIIWIKDDHIVGIEANATPPQENLNDDELERYISPVPVDKVLELPAGDIHLYDIKVGDNLIFNI